MPKYLFAHRFAVLCCCLYKISSSTTIAAAAVPTERSIKLGLGDFVFYSVLVSKAALYGFATCAACFLVIIAVSVSSSYFHLVDPIALPLLDA